MQISLHGGFGEKGRTCLSVASNGFSILLDAGVMTSARGRSDYYPDLSRKQLAAFDAIVITHSHEDHVGALGWCIANGFQGPVYMTGETREETDACLRAYGDEGHAQQLHATLVHPLRVGSEVLELGPFRVSTGRSGHMVGALWCLLDDGHSR